MPSYPILTERQQETINAELDRRVEVEGHHVLRPRFLSGKAPKTSCVSRGVEDGKSAPPHAAYSGHRRGQIL